MSTEFKFLVGDEVAAAEATMPVSQQVRWPLDTFVLYGFEDGRVVCRMAAMNLTVLEGSWTAEDKRGTTLAYRMMKLMEQFLVEHCAKTHSLALVWDEQPEIGDYLRRVGFEQFPVKFYSKELVKAEKVA